MERAANLPSWSCGFDSRSPPGSRGGACPAGRTRRGPVLRFVAAVDLDQLLTVPVIRRGQFVAHLSAKSKYGRLGLSFLNSVKVHSGFVGRLVLELVNLSNERNPITIRRGDPFMHIEFLRREGEPSPYSGKYMFQYMDERETELYMGILDENYGSLFPKKMLTKIRRNRLKTDEG